MKLRPHTVNRPENGITRVNAGACDGECAVRPPPSRTEANVIMSSTRRRMYGLTGRLFTKVHLFELEGEREDVRVRN